jgi:predicted metal-dependent phosphoesterase TrpH
VIVDLHLHTTASDGRCTPAELVDLAAAAGAGVIAATDHDTTLASADVAAFAAARGIEAVTGIEITAIDDARDVHMLGYFVDVQDAALRDFLASQRAIRLSRADRIAARLQELGMPVDLQPMTTAAAVSGRTIGRPQVADAMIAAGHVANRREAFDRWLAAGKPAFIPREGALPERVIDMVHRVGGIVSLAHPGRTGLSDDRICALAAAGLDAIEVYHCDHDESLVGHYGDLADRLGLLRTGGSDYHGDPAYAVSVGSASLPGEWWSRLRDAARTRQQ